MEKRIELLPFVERPVRVAGTFTALGEVVGHRALLMHGVTVEDEVAVDHAWILIGDTAVRRIEALGVAPGTPLTLTAVVRPYRSGLTQEESGLGLEDAAELRALVGGRWRSLGRAPQGGVFEGGGRRAWSESLMREQLMAMQRDMMLELKALRDERGGLDPVAEAALERYFAHAEPASPRQAIHVRRILDATV